MKEEGRKKSALSNTLGVFFLFQPGRVNLEGTLVRVRREGGAARSPHLWHRTPGYLTLRYGVLGDKTQQNGTSPCRT